MRSTGLHHQMHVDRRGDTVLAQRLAHHRADGQVRHVVIVHHVEVHEVGAGSQHGVDFLAQAGEVGGQDGGRDPRSGCHAIQFTRRAVGRPQADRRRASRRRRWADFLASQRRIRYTSPPSGLRGAGPIRASPGYSPAIVISPMSTEPQRIAAARVDVAADRHDVAIDVAQIAGDRDLVHGIGDGAALDPEAARAARVVARSRR